MSCEESLRRLLSTAHWLLNSLSKGHLILLWDHIEIVLDLLGLFDISESQITWLSVFWMVLMLRVSFLCVVELWILLNNILDIYLRENVVCSVPSLVHYWSQIELQLFQRSVGGVWSWALEIERLRLAIRRDWRIRHIFGWDHWFLIIVGFVLHMLILVLRRAGDVLIEELNDANDVFGLEYLPNYSIFLHLRVFGWLNWWRLHFWVTLLLQ